MNYLDLSLCDSSRAPGLTSGFQGSVNVHRGALLLVPQWRCISSFVFYNGIGQEMPKLANHSDLSVVRHVKVNDKHIPFYVFKQVQSKTKNKINFDKWVLLHNLSQFECHSILQTLYYNKYIDEVQHGAECMLSRVTMCSRWEMNLQWSIANKIRSCIIVLHCNVWSNYLSILFDRHVLRLMQSAPLFWHHHGPLNASKWTH